MINLKLAEMYADAILSIGVEQENLEQIEEDLLYTEQVFKNHAELSSFLNSPIVEASAKVSLVQEIFKGINPMALQFLCVMIERGRANYVVAAIEQFVIKSREVRGIVEAKVRVAKELSEANAAKLIARLEEISGKTVILDITKDPSIIGGFVVDIGDKRIDASVAQRMKGLGRALLENENYRLAKAQTTEIGGK